MPEWQQYAARVELALDRVLPNDDAQVTRLLAAMRYSSLGGGKRLRPSLVYATGSALGATLETLDAPAVAVELIHVYSLVHDDLPAMDNDDLRRGRPTCHRAYDEATAILAGDALQALAFAVLAGESALGAPTDATRALGMIRILADRIGTRGMAGGQAIDLSVVGREIPLDLLEEMHRRKTGALIEASVLLGAVAAGCQQGAQFEALRLFGRDIGLAFQIQDDILDVAGSSVQLGKTAGADASLAKPTWASLHGLDAARRAAAQLCERAIAALSELGRAREPLADIARFVIERQN